MGTSFAEVAPLPGFSREDDSLALRISEWAESKDNGSLGVDGCLGFAAWSLGEGLPFPVRVNSAGLIHGNTGEQGERDSSNSPRVYKVKIGMEEVAREQERLLQFLGEKSGDARLRLDANAALNMQTTELWLDWMRDRPEIEFLEQPVAVGMEELLMSEFGSAADRIALDESVVDNRDFDRMLKMGWPGKIVIKASLFGSPEPLFSLPRQTKERVIISSAFETGIGFGYVLKIAGQISTQAQVHGLGTRGFFADDGLDGWPPSTRYEGTVTEDRLEGVWKNATS